MSGRTMDNGMPVPGDGVSDSLGALEAAVRLHVADFHRARTAEGRRHRRILLAAAALACPLLFALGLLVEQQFDLLPLADATGGWRDWVWETYGPRIAECVIRHRADGADCPVVIGSNRR